MVVFLLVHVPSPFFYILWFRAKFGWKGGWAEEWDGMKGA